MNGKVVEQTRIRAGIARRMTESKQQAPHFVAQTEVAVDGASDRLAELNGCTDAPRMTMTVALPRGCVAALGAHPRLKSVWTQDGLLQADEVNVGIAIARDERLVAPALVGADGLDVPTMAATLADLAARALAQRLRPAKINAATFILSHLGIFEVTACAAIVAPPQVAIPATARPVEHWLLANDVPDGARC